MLEAILLLAFLSVGLADSAQGSSLEDMAQLKSQFILNFAKLVDWPAETVGLETDRFLIGICGDPYLWRACRREIAGKKIGGRRVALVPLSLDKALDPDPDMKVIFVYPDEETKLDTLLGALEDRPIILISDYPGFCERGGTIGLIEEKGRMHFEINRHIEGKTGVKMNSRLLQVARRVLE